MTSTRAICAGARDWMRLAALLVWTIPTIGHAGWRDGFTDPHDGHFDMAEYLLERKGAFPVPILITEPAVGYGGGVALVFFQQSLAELAAQTHGNTRYRPPDIYATGGFATENGTWGAGGGGMISFEDDRWRLRGGAAYAHLNLDFYGLGTAQGGPGVAYTLDGYGVIGELLYRLGASSAWVSARWQFLEFESDLGGSVPNPLPSAQRRSSGLGPSVEYDTRDNMFTPNRGWTGRLEALFYDPALGGDATFQTYRGRVFAYAPLGSRMVLGARADGRTATGDVPFYMAPFIVLRGIPAQRYQGEHVAVAESELRWNLTPRWALVGFGGAGRAWGYGLERDAVDTHGAGGAGFRYLVARRLGVYSGLDFAWGPDFAFYIQFGNAWR